MDTQAPQNELTADFSKTEIVAHKDDWWLTAQQIGENLEYTEPRDAVLKIYERNQEELADYSTIVNLPALDGKDRNMRIFNEEGVMLICMLSGQPKAKVFRKWAVAKLKEYRQTKMSELIKENNKLKLSLKHWHNVGFAACSALLGDGVLEQSIAVNLVATSFAAKMHPQPLKPKKQNPKKRNSD